MSNSRTVDGEQLLQCSVAGHHDHPVNYFLSSSIPLLLHLYLKSACSEVNT